MSTPDLLVLLNLLGIRLSEHKKTGHTASTSITQNNKTRKDSVVCCPDPVYLTLENIFHTWCVLTASHVCELALYDCVNIFPQVELA